MNRLLLIWDALSRGKNALDVARVFNYKIEQILYLQSKIDVYYSYIETKTNFIELSEKIDKLEPKINELVEEMTMLLNNADEKDIVTAYRILKSFLR